MSDALPDAIGASPHMSASSPLVIRIAKHAVLIALFAVAAVLGIASGVVFVFAADLPQISALDDYAPSTITRVQARDGDVIGEFATERRVVIPYERIAPRLRQAIIAAEDEDFEKHVGLSIPRIVIALVRDMLEGRKAAGASTLTQQLAKNLFLTPEKTWERKIKEALIAIQLEKRFTKDEIFALYANQIYLGHGAYGVEAAARVYFGKSASDLNLEEAAMIAGIIQLPSRQSPYVNMENALRRRNYALSRLAAEGYVPAADADAAKKRPIVTVGLRSESDSIAPWYVEDVRKYLEAKYGAKALYESGLTVRTPLDPTLQRAANVALQEGLRRLDKRHGWRAPTLNVAASGLDRYTHPRWERPMQDGDVVPAVVTKADATSIQVRVGALSGWIDKAGYAWTRRAAATQVVKAGDIVSVRLAAYDPRMPPSAGMFLGSLEQTPQVEGAVIALDNRTGQVLALVGGFDFERSKFNRANQAARQLGSTFKPIVYTSAIDRGYTPSSIIQDTPVSYPAGAGRPPWTPGNYDGRFLGPITLRHALEHSRNVPAVRIMDALGVNQVIGYARRFGFEGPLPPYLPIALGAAEASLVEVASAYSVFPNQGVRMRPYQVLGVSDRDGNVLEENRPEPTDAIRADTAFVLTNLLQGVVQRGTGAKAASLGWPLGGKTGTTNDYTDAWFIGFDPDITVGVWIGYDQKKNLGHGETGGQTALPIWMDIMRAWIGKRTEKPSFAQPGNVIVVSVDKATGAQTDAGTPNAIPEVFISGTQPGAAVR
ncbi:MAG: PBP1A family penicillin-binding protein [Acidobacteria bacterium]|nr:PBP1A family penicillin-binding protein [Acidobacteriota bacterium]